MVAVDEIGGVSRRISNYFFFYEFHDLSFQFKISH
jgi:hypothetical protein